MVVEGAIVCRPISWWGQVLKPASIATCMNIELEIIPAYSGILEEWWLVISHFEPSQR